MIKGSETSEIKRGDSRFKEKHHSIPLDYCGVVQISE